MLAGWGFMLWMTNDAYTIGQIKLSEDRLVSYVD